MKGVKRTEDGLRAAFRARLPVRELTAHEGLLLAHVEVLEQARVRDVYDLHAPQLPLALRLRYVGGARTSWMLSTLMWSLDASSADKSVMRFSAFFRSSQRSSSASIASPTVGTVATQFPSSQRFFYKTGSKQREMIYR